MSLAMFGVVNTANKQRPYISAAYSIRANKYERIREIQLRSTLWWAPCYDLLGRLALNQIWSQSVSAQHPRHVIQMAVNHLMAWIICRGLRTLNKTRVVIQPISKMFIAANFFFSRERVNRIGGLFSNEFQWSWASKKFGNKSKQSAWHLWNELRKMHINTDCFAVGKYKKKYTRREERGGRLIWNVFNGTVGSGINSVRQGSLSLPARRPLKYSRRIGRTRHPATEPSPHPQRTRFTAVISPPSDLLVSCPA